MSFSQEDDVVRRMVAQHGARQWSVIAEQLPGRVGKQCRERCENTQHNSSTRMLTRHRVRARMCSECSCRWQNHLSPDVRKGPWSEKEEETLIKAHRCASLSASARWPAERPEPTNDACVGYGEIAGPRFRNSYLAELTTQSKITGTVIPCR